MANLKLSIEEFEEDDFIIIAIHTTLEDYRLAYFLNLNLGVLLSKNKNDVESQEKAGKTSFARFTFEDKKNFINWDLVQNKNEIEISENSNNQDLFSGLKNKFSTAAYLLSEYKKVDFFLKIENAEKEINIDEIVTKIKNIESINMVYAVDSEKIKSKNNLIF
jgi:hypothetical protein